MNQRDVKDFFQLKILDVTLCNKKNKKQRNFQLKVLLLWRKNFLSMFRLTAALLLQHNDWHCHETKSQVNILA